MTQVSKFEQVLESVETLSLEEQEALIDLIRRRLTEHRREEIAKNIAQAQLEYQTGKAFRGTVDEIIALVKKVKTLVLNVNLESGEEEIVLINIGTHDEVY